MLFSVRIRTGKYYSGGGVRGGVGVGVGGEGYLS